MRTFAKTAFAFAFLLLLQGCDSIIEDVEPSTAVSQEEALSNPDAIRSIRASMYARMHGTALSTDWLLGPSALADNTFFRSNQGRHQGLNLFGTSPRNGIGTGAYDDLYAMINEANILISGIEEGVLPEAEASKLRAEAFFMRALAHHHLVRIFGYDPDGEGGVVDPNSGPGQGWELGVVIQTEPTLAIEDVIQKPRSTVLEVYDQIESDLSEALNLFQNLDEDAGEGVPFFASEASVQALMARVNLYERDWAEADTRAQAAIDAAGALFGSELAEPSELEAIFDERVPNPEAIFTISTNPTTESAGVNNAISAYTTLQWLAQLPTQDLVSLYEEEDARLDAWYEPCFDEINNVEPSGCAAVNDAGFELHKYAAEQNPSQFADDYVHLRIAEMVLIQAEARLNTSGVAPAIERLNDLRAQRNADALNAGSFDFDSAYDAILAERRRELVAEGHRFFDLKRLGRDIDKAFGTGREDVPFSYYGILDDIPPSQLEVNEELVQNPGYLD